MTKKTSLKRIATGVRNLDAMLHGGLPKGTATVISGPPGSGKTILSQQICLHNASARQRVLYLSTLSEPTAKTLRYLSQLTFFDAKKLAEGMQFVDLGVIVRSQGLAEVSPLIMEHLKRIRPAIVVVDSFKVFDDLARSQEDLRKFSYEIAVNLMAWEATALLLGEYGPQDFATNPLFSVVDGLLVLGQRESSGEQKRFIQLVKMRGTGHSRDEHTFDITTGGIEIYAPRLTIRRQPREDAASGPGCKTGVSKLDEILGGGIPWGASLLISGVAGTGKTVLSLEFLYRGAQAGERGVLFSFEETDVRLRAAARGLGWDLDREIESGMIEIVFIPQPEIRVDADLTMMRERIEARSARRVVVDSVSVLLHKLKDPEAIREKVFQLASVVQNHQAVGLFVTDIPYGQDRISRFGVEETVADGVILLSSTQEGLERQRYIEVYKLRGRAHLQGRHNLRIGPEGIVVFPRYRDEAQLGAPPASVEITRRLSCGVPGLDPLLGGGLLERSITLVSGSAGIGKSTLGLHFILEGARRGERGLYVSLEEGPAQLEKSAEALGLPLGEATREGRVEIAYLSRAHVRAAQYLALLADRIHASQASRLVLDSIGQLVAGGALADQEEVLHSLAVRFKALGATSLFTVESSSLLATDPIRDHGFSPVADNLLVMRYVDVEGRLDPSLTVVKTRGSAHDRATYLFDITEGGMRVGRRLSGPAGGPAGRPAPRQPAPPSKAR